MNEGEGMASHRLLVVHAHPDDESSKGAATSARYADADDTDVVLVTCTGGEAGEVLNEKLGEIPPEELTALRERELAEAVGAIGFARTYGLGERDSGWHEDLNEIPGAPCFWHAPVGRPAGRLAAILRVERPQVIVTYPPDGGYPHPDHIQTHRVTMAAVDLAADPAAEVEGEPWEVARVVGTTVFTRPRLIALHEAMLDADHESPYGDWLEDDERPLRDADRLPVAARLDVADWFPRRDAALLAHASQVDPDGLWFAVPRDVEVEAWPWEEFVCLRPKAIDGAPLDDLFAGL